MMMQFSRRAAIRGIAASGLAGISASRTHAQSEAWPSRPIRWLVGVPPAGSADPLTRAVAEPLSKRLNQSVVIENKSGAAQAIAARDLALSPPDGHTLMTVAGPVVYANPTPIIGNGLDPVIQLVSQPMIIAGTVQRPTMTLRDVIEAAKAAPDEWSYACAGGVGSSHHVAGELLNLRAGTKIQHVPYRGGGAAMTDALSGQIPLIIIGAGPVIPQLQAGKLRAYGLTTKSRLASLPDVPTISEFGFADFDLAQWFGVSIRSGTPQPIVQRLNAEINEILTTAAVQDMVTKLGAETIGGSAGKWGEIYAQEQRKWTGLVKQLNIPLL